MLWSSRIYAVPDERIPTLPLYVLIESTLSVHFRVFSISPVELKIRMSQFLPSPLFDNTTERTFVSALKSYVVRVLELYSVTFGLSLVKSSVYTALLATAQTLFEEIYLVS